MIQIKWSVQEGNDFQETYMTNYCYWKGPQVYESRASNRPSSYSWPLTMLQNHPGLCYNRRKHRLQRDCDIV